MDKAHVLRTLVSSLSTAVPTTATLLHLISDSTTHSHLSQIHARLVTAGHRASLPTTTKLIQRLCSLGATSHALLLFSSFPDPDTFLFNVLLRSHLPLYSQLLRHTSLQPDNFSFSFAIKAASSLSTAQLLHAHAVVSGFSSDRFVGSSLVHVYMGFSHVSVAEKVFDGILRPDVISCNALLSGLVQNCSFLKAAELFEGMVRRGTSWWDSTTLAQVLPAAAELKNLNLGTELHCLGLKAGFLDHVFIITSLISMYSKFGEIDIAIELFASMREVADLVAWNSIIAGCSLNGYVGTAVKLFREMLVFGWKVNSCTMLGLIPVSDPIGNAELCESIHGLAVKTGLNKDCSVSTALITAYSKVNNMNSAESLFDSMPEKSLISWNAIISGSVQNGRSEMAVSLFKHMQSLNIRPNLVTVTIILSACAHLGSLGVGKWIHQVIEDEKLEPNVFVSSAMIDMYAKCGSIKASREIFDGMSEKNAVSWNAMIAGYGLHGHGRESINLFDKMLNAGVAPTEITFLSLMYACSHSGMVEDGCKIFHSMESDYGIKPNSEHYACMVDLFGRSGRLDEAFEFIQKISGNFGPGVWGALLGACMIHRNVELARIASEKLFELEPDSMGHYVLLSNLHSANNNFSEAASIRQEVRSKKLIKAPGCTLIEIGNVMHVFTSGDKSHEKTEAIYSELESLTERIVEIGYQPLIGVAFYDVDEEEKAHMVKIHSEKLAICFGLISTEPGTEIRIIKNLRVCLDCHTATKFISKITEREIVVRDANRFHHFKDGSCSCGDYW